MGWRNLSKTAEKSSSSPRAAGVFYQLTWRNIVREAHTRLMSLAVCLYVQNKKTSRFVMEEWKLGCQCGVICPLSIPSENLFLCARRKFGFNKKIHRNLLFVYVYYQPNFCNTHAMCEWAKGTFLRQQKKNPPAQVQWVYLEECSEESPHQINVSVCLSVLPEYQNT